MSEEFVIVQKAIVEKIDDNRISDELVPLVSSIARLNSSIAAVSSALPEQAFKASRKVFFELHEALDVLERLPHNNKGNMKNGVLKNHGQSITSTLLSVLSSPKLEVTEPFWRLIGGCLCAALRRQEEISAASLLFDLCAMADLKKCSVTTRIAVLRVAGDIGVMTGVRVVSVLPNFVAACGKHLRSSEPTVKIAAIEALAAVIAGVGDVGGAVHPNALKFATRACSDRCPEVRFGGAMCLLALARASDNFQSIGIEAVLIPCARSLDDASPGVVLAMANCVAGVLAVSIEGTSGLGGHSKFSSASRDQDDDDVKSGMANNHGQSSIDKISARLKEMSAEMKAGVAKLPDKRIPPIEEAGFRLEPAIQWLCSLFYRATYPSPGTREFMSGASLCVVAFLRYSDVSKKISSSSVTWIVRTLVDLLETDKLPQNGNEACIVRSAVEYIVREGLCSGSSEGKQLLIAREILTVLGEVSGRAQPGQGFQPLLNEHQLQVCLVELSHLVTTLGQAAAALKDNIHGCLVPLVAHPSYGVRFEAAVALAATGHALPHATAGLLQGCISEIRYQFDTLTAHSTPRNGNESNLSDMDHGEVGSTLTSPNSALPESIRGLHTSIEDDGMAKIGIGNTSDKRVRIYSLHGNTAAASMLLQVAQKLPLGIPSEISLNSKDIAKNMILVQFPDLSSKSTVNMNMGVICTAVRTGWSLVSSLFGYNNGLWAEQHCCELLVLWERSAFAAQYGQSEALCGVEHTHDLIFLDASTRALLCFMRTAPMALYTVPGALGRCVSVLESSVISIEGRLKSPSKTQGIICRTLLKAMLLECFAWLPPGCFPETCEKLCAWGLDHFRMYTANDVEASLLPALLDPTDSSLEAMGSCRLPPYQGIGIPFEGDDTADALALHALLAGIPVGHQERDALVGSASIWPDSEILDSNQGSEGRGEIPPTPLHGDNWRRPPGSSSSINVRLLDAAISVFAATFGYQGEEFQANSMEAIIALLPDAFKPGMNARKDVFGLGGLVTEDERRRRDRKQHLGTANVATLMLALLRSLPPYTDSRYNVVLPWVARAREVLLELLAAPSAAVRRAAGECMGLLALKVGDGFAIYIVQALLEILRRRVGGVSPIPMPPSEGGLAGTWRAAGLAESPASAAIRRAGALFALGCVKRCMGGGVLVSWFWADVRRCLAVGGDVPHPAREWGLHTVSMLVRAEEDIPVNFSQVQSTLQWCTGIIELLEAHAMGIWTVHAAAKSAVSGVSSGGGVAASGVDRGGQSAIAGEVCLLATLFGLASTLLPLLQSMQPGCPELRRLTVVWGALTLSVSTDGRTNSRVINQCIGFVEVLAMLAPDYIPSVLPRALKVLSGVLNLPSQTSPGCVLAASRCIKLLISRLPDVLENTSIEIPILCALEQISGGKAWGGAPYWRGLALSRDLEGHQERWHIAEIQILATIDVLANCHTCENNKDGGYWPLHWILLARSLIMPQGGGGRLLSAESNFPIEGDMGDVDEYDNSDNKPSTELKSSVKKIEWMSVSMSARRSLADLTEPLTGVRWQVKLYAMKCCLSILRLLIKRKDPRIMQIDIRAARGAVSSYVIQNFSTGSQSWKSSPQFLCLFMDDLISIGVAAATASTDDSELYELQSAGVQILLEVIYAFSKAEDPDSDVRGYRTLEQSISQMSSATRPATTCRVSPDLVKWGCKLVLVLVREGLIGDIAVLRRLVKQIIPSDILLHRGGSLKATGPQEGTESEHIYGDAWTENVRTPSSDSFSVQVALEERVIRLRTLAALSLEGELDIVCMYHPALRLSWVALCVDAVRVAQGLGNWPKAFPVPIRSAGLLYPCGIKLAALHRIFTDQWQVVACACSGLCKTANDMRSCKFILSASCCALISLSNSEDQKDNTEMEKYLFTAILNILSPSRSNSQLGSDVVFLLPATILRQIILLVNKHPMRCIESSNGPIRTILLQILGSLLENGGGVNLIDKLQRTAEEESDIVEKKACYELWSLLATTIVTSLLESYPNLLGTQNSLRDIESVILLSSLLSKLASICPDHQLSDRISGLLSLSLRLLEVCAADCYVNSEHDDHMTKVGQCAIASIIACLQKFKKHDSTHTQMIQNSDTSDHDSFQDESERASTFASSHEDPNVGLVMSSTCFIGGRITNLFLSVLESTIEDDFRISLLFDAWYSVLIFAKENCNNSFVKGFVEPIQNVLMECIGSFPANPKINFLRAIRKKMIEDVGSNFLFSIFGPHIITTLAIEVASNREYPPKSAAYEKCLTECCKAVFTIVTASASENKRAVLQLVMPLFVRVLALELNGISSLIGYTLLQYATFELEAFKESLLGLSQTDRLIVESAVRKAVTDKPATNQNNAIQQTTQNKIKLDFSIYSTK